MDFDISKPNPARIYDYMLGGSHNFEADRIAAERVLALVPSVVKGARLNRWFIDSAIEKLQQQGFNCYIDLASGLPTQGYIHDLAPNAKVIYNDIDAVTVAYSQEILADNPNVKYLLSDMAHIETILAEADRFFNNDRRVGVFIIGVTYFISDENLKHILDILYDWCAPGSQVALSWVVGGEFDPRSQSVMEMYKKMNQPIYLRSLQEIQGFLTKWRMVDPGLFLLHEMFEVENWKSEEESNQDLGDAYGVIIEKQ